MSNRDQNKRDNDALQSSEIDAALGEDERAFGAGGQRTSGPLSSDDDASDRDADRDPTLPDSTEAEGHPS